jgi:hypothetical protein
MERFGGYGVMGLPFASGHVLGLRRFTASSVGAGYSSVWHRDPGGNWTFYADVPALHGCARYFGNDVSRAVEGPIELSWPEPRHLSVRMPAAGFEWDAWMSATPATRAMNMMSRLMPDAFWHNRRVLSMMAAIAGPMLGAGRLGMYGRAPNGQQFIANPMVIWTIERSEARLDGQSFGEPGLLDEQARVGDFWIPQRGVFVIGRAFFDAFDPDRHLAVASREAQARQAQ